MSARLLFRCRFLQYICTKFAGPSGITCMFVMNRLFLILVLSCYSTLIFAQQRINVNGTVSNIASAPISGATVHLLNTNFATATNEQGGFLLQNVPAGNY